MLRRSSDLPAGCGIPYGPLRLCAPGRHAAPPEEKRTLSLPIWSCSVRGLPCRVHCWPRGALLPHHFTLTSAAYSAKAVCFLLHLPSRRLQAPVPDVIRHTALWSSDFPPPPNLLAEPSGSDHPAACLFSLRYGGQNSVSRNRSGSPLAWWRCFGVFAMWNDKRKLL